MKKLNVIILRNELDWDHNLWIKACEDFKEKVEYSIVNLTSDSWLKEIQKRDFNVLLAKPGGLTAPFKQLYDERIYILSVVLGYKIFPSPDEIFIYENKRFLSFWLEANNIPHPATHVFYNRIESIQFMENCQLPIVGKTNIGASGSGVNFLHSKTSAIEYINLAFSGRGVPKRTGPNLMKNNLLGRGLKYLIRPYEISKKLRIYRANKEDLQQFFVILQEYISHDFEWRVVRIGNSYFAHKKLKTGEKASGSLRKGYDNPPLSLFEFVRNITERHKFYSMSLDIFETPNGYLVNEMQCIFGQSDDYQMLVDGNPGRYLYVNEHWEFQQGYFNSNECFNLRLEYILDNKDILLGQK